MMVTNRRQFVSAMLAAPLVAARAARPAAARDRDRFADAWERYKESLVRQWEKILRLNDRVKLHRPSVYDAHVTSLCEDVQLENRIQDAELKTLSKG